MVYGIRIFSIENNWHGSYRVDINLKVVYDWLQINWSHHVILNRNYLEPKPIVNIIDKTQWWNRLMRGKNLSSNKDKKRFSNRSYKYDYVKINNAQSLPQHLLHTIRNSQNLSRKKIYPVVISDQLSNRNNYKYWNKNKSYEQITYLMNI